VLLHLNGKAGRLEALHEAPSATRFAAIVCHPHPLFGGTMNNPATYRLAKALRSRGGAVLRFNFRGVGSSAGAHGNGRGEIEDAQIGLAWLAERHPELPLYASGFSFGAWVALEAGCHHPEVRGILCAGLALSLREMELSTAQSCPKPVAVIQGEHDRFGSPAEVQALLEGSAGPRRVSVVAGASHLFKEDSRALEREATIAMDWLLPTEPRTNAPAQRGSDP